MKEKLGECLGAQMHGEKLKVLVLFNTKILKKESNKYHLNGICYVPVKWHSCL